MKRIFSPVGLGVSAAILSVLAVGTFFGIKTFAISSQGPDTTGGAGESYLREGDNAKASVYYELSNTTNVVSTSLKIPVYYAAKTTSTTVSVTCSDGSGTPKVGSNSICSGARKFTLTGFSSTPDPNSGYYVAIITVTLPGGQSDMNYRAFRLSVPNGGLIGYSQSNTSQFALANVDRCDAVGSAGDPAGDTAGCNHYFDYTLPFAGACDIGTGPQVIDIFDADNTGSGGQYNIQPQTFSVKVHDVTSNTNVGYGFSGSYGNNSHAYLRFTYTAHHKYQLLMTHVYANNVIQLHLPFDSIFYKVGCPDGQITSSATGACNDIVGYAYNAASPTTPMVYYVYVNPPAGTPTAYTAGSTPPATAGFRGPGNVNQTNPPGTPSNIPANHGFDSPVHAPTGQGLDEYHYNGAWATNVYWVYARASGTSNINLIDRITVPVDSQPKNQCASTTCNSTMIDGFDGKNGVNVGITFHVSSQLSGTTDLPPAVSTFSVTVNTPTGPVTITPNPTATAKNGYAVSSDINYTPGQVGNYSVTWSFDSQPACTSPTVVIGYNPYFDVEGGDISAGAGFGTSACTQSTADIASWNYDNSPTGYYGAGSQNAAIASGVLRSFVTGLKPASNKSDPASRTGTDSLNFVGTPTALSFANAGSGVDTTAGHYGGNYTDGGGTLPCIPDYAAESTGGASWSGDFSQSGVYAASGNTVIATGGVNLSSDTVIKLRVNGNVYIDGNITYSNGSPLHYPRFDLIATGNIYVSGSVSELHGLYVAEGTTSAPGTFSTCANDTANVYTETTDYDTCNHSLAIYGAVAADKLSLDRTFGTLASSTDPAESFRYTPEFWLATPECTAIPTSPQCQQPGATGQKTDAIISLPPVL